MGPKAAPIIYPVPFDRSSSEDTTTWIYGDGEGANMPGPASGSLILFYGYDDDQSAQGQVLAKVLDFDKQTGLLQLLFLGAEDEYLHWWLFSPSSEGGMNGQQKFHLCRTHFWSCQVKNPSRGVNAPPYFHIDSYKIVTLEAATALLAEWKLEMPAVALSPPVRPTRAEIENMSNKKRPAQGLLALTNRREKLKKKKRAPVSGDEQWSAEDWSKWEQEQSGSSSSVSPPKTKADRAAEGLLDEELRDLSKQFGTEGEDSALKDQLVDLQRRLGGTQGPSTKTVKKSTQELLVERAKKEADLAKAKSAASSKELEAGGDATVLLKFIRGVVKARDSDLVPSDDDFGDDEDAAPSGGPLKSKRALLRRIAAKRPGLLLAKGLAMMREQLQPLSGDADEDVLTPACVRYFMTVYLPNHRQVPEHQLRELRTLCEAIDGLLRGKSVRVLDLLMQRLKAAMMAYNDNSWSSARWLELLPPEVKASPISIDEEELVRKVQSGELSMQELIRKVKDGKSGEKG